MWRRARVYKCDICGKEEVGRMIYTWDIDVSWTLPKDWNGSEGKKASCFCKECTEAIKEVRIKNE